jgi:hypothetical protein
MYRQKKSKKKTKLKVIRSGIFNRSVFILHNSISLTRVRVNIGFSLRAVKAVNFSVFCSNAQFEIITTAHLPMLFFLTMCICEQASVDIFCTICYMCNFLKEHREGKLSLAL